MAHSDDDEIDSEALQARMDLTMSFAHNLVTSWMQTTQVAQPHPGISDAERILKEELRRPPRLGVGAPVPASSLRSPFSRTTSQDEEEEKGKSVKRAKRNDPFAMPGLKRRKKVDDALNKLSPEPGCSTNGINSHNNEQVTQKARTENFSREQSTYVTGLTAVGTTPAKSAVATSSPTTQRSIPRSEDPTPSRGCAEGGGKSTVPIPDTALQSTGSCPTPSPMSVQHSVPSKHARFSLLNLDGPPDLQQAGNSTTPNISSKQRRRRKKKKNFTTGTGTGAT
ncbi:hypothetical protein EDC04DRAFT_2887251 [Pisolithus marmoratus]|nr:hypothetical protein EDC04DRAFT_2887251 [Pisolithus marmoratus]